MTTQTKNQTRKIYKSSPHSENSNPNLVKSTPGKKPIKKDTPIKTPIQKKLKKEPKSDQEHKEKTQLDDQIQCEDVELEGSSKVRKLKSLMLEEAMVNIPESGEGRVMHLVNAFEKLLSITKDKSDESSSSKNKNKGKVTNWALPGYQKLSVTADISWPSQFEIECSENSCVGSNGDRLGSEGSTSASNKRSHNKSTSSSQRSWNKKLKATTSQHPFKLRTELRGKCKEEQFISKVKEMLMEEEKQRIPIAQGLPLTTEYPECLVKPSVKDATEPIDLVLHSDVRAQGRAEYDHHVAERMNLIEHIKLEKERLQKMEEEEEIRRLRKELVPKAQPMPYFDRPLIPKKSRKGQTIPKEPQINFRQAKLRRKIKPPYAEVNG